MYPVTISVYFRDNRKETRTIFADTEREFAHEVGKIEALPDFASWNRWSTGPIGRR